MQGLFTILGIVMGLSKRWDLVLLGPFQNIGIGIGIGYCKGLNITLVLAIGNWY